MAISPLYIPLFTIEEVILDKDSGLPLANGVVSFYSDAQRLTPKVVYKISGVSPNYTFISVGSQLTLGLAGDFVDEDGNPFVPYAFPYDAEGEVDLYFVRVVSDGGVAQFTREAVPYISSGVIPPSDRSNTDNELCNPQFVEVNFPSPGATVLNVSGSNTVTGIAPGWDMITSGTGTVTVERLEPTAANVVTNPPYTLRIQADAALGNSIILRQTLDNSPSIFRNGFVSGTFIAAVISGGSSFISMDYVPSTGTSSQIIPSTSIPTDGAYHSITGTVVIPDQTNDAASVGFVNIDINIPTSRNIAISSIQIVGVSDATDIPFDEQTAARQKDLLFHYYKNAILIQPKKSIAAGWNFRGNPWQFNAGTGTTISTTPVYTADQTIVVTSAANSVSVSRTTDPLGLFQISALSSVTQGQIAVFQYIDPRTALPYYGYQAAALVRARIVTSVNTQVKVKFRAFTTNGTVSSLSPTYPIASWDANGNPIFAAGFTAIIPENDPAYTLLNAYDPDIEIDGPVCPAMAFNGMDFFTQLSGLSPNAVAGIMMYTVGTLSNSPTDSILLDSISFVPNEFAMDSVALTYDEMLRECQFYYEKSYNLDVLPGTASTPGQASVIMAVNSINVSGMDRPYKVTKRTQPTVSFYSPVTGAVNNVRTTQGIGGDLTTIAIVGAGVSSTGNPNLGTAASDQATITAQWVADARIGL